jgi:hypothetical protein
LSLQVKGSVSSPDRQEQIISFLFCVTGEGRRAKTVGKNMTRNKLTSNPSKECRSSVSDDVGDESDSIPFERLLELNPADNQGARFCWDAVGRGIPWEQFDA